MPRRYYKPDNIVQCTKTDCKYYSNYTNTCDYTIMEHRQKPCTIADCTVYTPEDKSRTWSVFTQFPKQYKRPYDPLYDDDIIMNRGDDE